MNKIAVSLTKGGVGKTTTAVNLAAGLANAGAKVLLVDTDTQGQAGYMLGVQTQAGMAEVLLKNIRAEDAVMEAREKLWLLAGGEPLAGVKREIELKAAGGEKVLGKALASLEGSYDFVILDTSPGWDVMTINVLFYSDEILVPVSLEMLSIKGLVEFSRRMTTVRKYKPVTLNYIVPTFLDGRVKKSGVILQKLQEHFGRKICAPIRYNVKLSEAAGHGQTIYEYAPSSAGAHDYQRLTQRIFKNGKAKT